MYKLTEIIDVKEIQTMAEHFYLLTQISHQLLDCNGGIIFHYSTPSSDIHLHAKIHVPIIFNENKIGDFVA